MKIVFSSLVSLIIVAILLGKSDMAAPWLDTLDKVDKQLMIVLNHDGGPAADVFWTIMSSNLVWTSLGAVFLFGISGRGIKEKILIILYLALTVMLCDQVSSSFFKPFFDRLRPSHCNEINGLLHYVGSYRGGCHGFVSSHAANAFGIATYIILLFRSKRIVIPIFIWACSVSYSRIYLGVHYLGDVLGGAVLGVTIGIFCNRILKHIHPLQSVNCMITHARMSSRLSFPQVFAITVFLTFAAVFCYSYVITFTPRLLVLM